MVESYILPLAVSENNNALTESYLYQNYPNPFDETTKIKYNVGRNNNLDFQHVKVMIYNIYGEEIAILVNQMQPPGEYEINYSSAKLTSGVYFYQLIITNSHSGVKYNEIKKMVRIK